MSSIALAGRPLPAALVQPAAAAVPAPAPAGPPSAPAAPAAVPKLDVPVEFAARLDQAMAEGVADAEAFARDHTPAERWMVPDWALLRMKWPPRDDAEDLAYLHQVARARTPDGIAAARHWAKHGLTDEWNRHLEQYMDRATPPQARAGRKLLNDALMMVNTITQTAKAGAARRRPFDVDPTLPLVVDRPGNNPSYPSGHASAAYAAGLVLAHLMPDRRDEFLGLAREASWARVYSGVHFPTDVVAGAKLATTVAHYLAENSLARPLPGGRNDRSSDSAAGSPLPDAPKLAGQPLAGGAGAVMGHGQPGS